MARSTTLDNISGALVWYETTSQILDAIAREKQVKGWRREKKTELIEEDNPGWVDLAGDWYR